VAAVCVLLGMVITE